jgi:hypothetical protein
MRILLALVAFAVALSTMLACSGPQPGCAYGNNCLPLDAGDGGTE